MHLLPDGCSIFCCLLFIPASAHLQRLLHTAVSVCLMSPQLASLAHLIAPETRARLRPKLKPRRTAASAYIVMLALRILAGRLAPLLRHCKAVLTLCTRCNDSSQHARADIQLQCKLGGLGNHKSCSCGHAFCRASSYRCSPATPSSLRKHGRFCPSSPFSW